MQTKGQCGPAQTTMDLNPGSTSFTTPSRLFRIEILVLCGLCCSAAVSICFSVEFYTPSWGVAAFIWKHYLGALIPALMVSWVVMLILKRKQKPLVDQLEFALRQSSALLVIVYLHFNFKLWAQLINRLSFDDLYNRIDGYFQPIVDIAYRFDSLSNHLFPDTMNPYHELFVAMFALSYISHSLTGRWQELESVLLATSIVILGGGVCYAVAPAIGPLIYGFGHGVTEIIQRDMLDFHRVFIGSAGAVYDDRKFVASLAAMPSLHVANAFVLTYFAWRYVRWICLPFVLLTVFFAFEAIALRWHYLVDIPVGLLLAGFAIWIAEMSPASETKRFFRACGGLRYILWCSEEKRST